MTNKQTYENYKKRNHLTYQYIKTRNNANVPDIKLGVVADIADQLDEEQTMWLLGQRIDDESVGRVAGRLVIDAYAMQQVIDYDTRVWIDVQAKNAGVSFGEMVAAILKDVYDEEHNYD